MPNQAWYFQWLVALITFQGKLDGEKSVQWWGKSSFDKDPFVRKIAGAGISNLFPGLIQR